MPDSYRVTLDVKIKLDWRKPAMTQQDKVERAQMQGSANALAARTRKMLTEYMRIGRVINDA